MSKSARAVPIRGGILTKKLNLPEIDTQWNTKAHTNLCKLAAVAFYVFSYTPHQQEHMEIREIRSNGDKNSGNSASGCSEYATKAAE